MNNANDSTFFSPIITYTEITDEEAPVYSNRDEPIIQNTDYFSALRDGSGTNTEGSDDSTDSMPFSIWLSLLSGIGAAIIIGGITILILVVIKKETKQKAVRISYFKQKVVADGIVFQEEFIRTIQ